ncbi:MAG: UvrD-helicase domain-containing protein [Prevotella sp.]|nr:UvrD-helicase domain-containing protein [Prevotella sp.]
MKAFQMDDSQRAVAEAWGGYHLVLASPGCGKTHLLAERVRRAHELGVDYEDMLCLTFTNRAAREMTNRIGESAQYIMVGNVHRFCSKFLFEGGMIEADSSIIDDEEAISIIADYRNEDEESVANDFNRSRTYQLIIFFSHLMQQIAMNHSPDLFLHPESMTEDDRQSLRLLCAMQKRPCNVEALLDVYHHASDYFDDADAHPWEIAQKIRALLWKMEYAWKYDEYKRENHMLDFEDLLIRTYDVYTEREDCRRYHWIQVDEVQDLNAMQLAIIDLLTAKDDATVVYLGDEQQAIFSFMGAKVETLDKLKERCRGHIHHLMRNHRSPSYLLDVFNDYAEKRLNIPRELLPTTDWLVKAHKNELRIIHSSTLETEICDVVELARNLYEQDINETTAVIVNSNADADRISEEMARIDLSHFKVSGRDLFDMKEVKLLLAHLNVVANEGSFIGWTRILKGLKVLPSNPLARRFVYKLRQLALSPTDFLLYNGSTYVAEYVQAYENCELIVFDTETTGVNVFADDIIEISAMRIRQGQVVGEPLDIYIRTDKEIPSMLGEKPNPMKSLYHQKEKSGELLEPLEAFRLFLDYVGDRPVLGHNVAFDVQMVRHHLMRSGGESLRPFEAMTFDTLKLTRLLEPNLHSYKLESLLERFGLEGINSHRAIDDVAATVSLINYCYDKAKGFVDKQMAFIRHPKVQPFANKFRSNYLELYMKTVGRLYDVEDNAEPALVCELKRVYDYLRENGFIEEIGRFNYIIDYLSKDMITDVADAPSLIEQLSCYLLDINTMKEADFCNSKSLREKVYVTTVHKAKGLEFDNVIVFDAVAGRYPNHFNKHPRQDAEDARKFYVAISRAKRRLYVAYSMQSIDRYGGIHDREITPFMTEIMAYFS